MSTHDDDDDYEVGYGKPPKATQFKKGESGNRKGRPKEARSIDDVLRKRLYAKYTVQENGRPKRVTLLEVIVSKLLKRAADGDHRSIALLLKLLPQVPIDSDGPAGGAVSPESDRQVLEEFARIMGGTLDGLLDETEARPNG